MENYRINREIVTEFFTKKFCRHTDWTGTRVETRFECESVEEFIDIFMDYLKENDCD